MNRVKQPIIFVIGGPGSGKGTQCALLERNFGYANFSPGELLRNEVKVGSPRGDQIKETMTRGELVPTEWTVGLLKDAIDGVPHAKGYLIDGFPRSIEQRIKFEELIRPCDLVLVFECSEELMIQRISQRAETSGRVDDNEDTVRKRLANSVRDTLPVIEYYQSLPNMVAKVNAEGTIEEVYSNISAVLQERFQ